MGSLAESSSLQTLKMMKSIAVVALCMFAAVAGEAEASADAGVLYGHYGYGHHLGYATMDTMAMDTHTGTMDTTMARGLLMPSPLPMLPMLTMAMDTMAMATMAMPMPMDTMHTHMPTTMATSMARGLLMPSPLLMLPMLTMAMDMDTMAMD